jgi:hypothetical protein
MANSLSGAAKPAIDPDALPTSSIRFREDDGG